MIVRSVDYCRGAEGEAAETRVSRTVHDPNGRAIGLWDPRLFLNVSAPANLSTTHNLSGTVLCSVSVDSGVHVCLFGEAGQPVHSWDGRGSQRWMDYDNQLRVTALFEQAAQGAETCAERLCYAANDPALADHNLCGRLICHEDLPGALRFNDYGLAGAVLVQERRFGDAPSPVFTTHSRFTPLGDLLSRTDARGNGQRFSQTLDGQLRSVDLRLNDTAEWLPMVSDITYNPQAQVAQQVAGNRVITTLEYTAEDGRLSGLVSRLGQNDPLQDLRYTYDPVGNVSRIEDAALPIRYFANQRIEPVSHYRYDTLNRLIEASGWEAGSVQHGPTSTLTTDPAMPGHYRQTYRYDDGNNLLELTHVGPQNHGHRLVADAHSNRCLPVRDGIEPGEDDFRDGFDPNGNLLRLQPGQTLTWDLRNQLCEVRPVERQSADDDYERYEYGADGMRVRKVRSLQTNAQTNVIETVYLPGLEIRTHSGTGEILHVIEVATGRGNVRVLHWGAGKPEGIANNQQRHNLTDHLGSSTLELDQDGKVITQERYYPCGGTCWSNGEAVQVSYKTVRYSGKEQDATGLYYYGFRYYGPWLQRWISPDPAGEADGHNRYRAMRNNPVTYKDAEGLMPRLTNKNEPVDETYHDLARQGLVHPLQASGMQPIRDYYENSEDSRVQAFRKGIPFALAELSANGNNRPFNTHQAHLVAAARAGTAPPSGPVLYHSGELVSSVMSSVIGAKGTSQVMGPLAEAFNSPTESPDVLAVRRDAVATSFVALGKWGLHVSNPRLRIFGAASLAVGNLMQLSEAQTVTQYNMLTRSGVSNHSAPAEPQRFSGPTFVQSTLSEQQQPPVEESVLDSVLPSPLAQQLYDAAFNEVASGAVS